MKFKSIMVIFTLIIITTCIFGNFNVSLAKLKEDSDDIKIQQDTPDDIVEGANSFIKTGEKEAKDAIDPAKIKKSSDFIYNLLLAIAIVIAVVVGIMLGIKLMLASIEEQAQVKEALAAYVVGCIVVFGAMGIWKLGVVTFSKF